MENKSGELSRSKQKRIEREKKENAKKRTSLITRVIITAVIVIVVGAIAGGIGYSIYKSSQELVANNEYSAQLDDNGFIKGADAKDYLTLADYKNLVVPEKETEYSDEEIDADINSVLESHKVLNTEEGTIADGDTVNIDYVGTIDGEEFEGGNSNGAGSELTIGSGTFIDDFEQQLIGYRVGENLNVEVTFPEDYSTAELAGKDAVFAVTINGIYELPEFTDDFVAENLSDKATTVNGYFQYLKDTNYDSKLTSYIENYLKENSTVNSYPKKYLKNLKETMMYSDNDSYEYMNQMYIQYYGQGYNSFEEYTGMTNEEYLADVATRAEEECKEDLIYQAILQDEGVTISVDEVKAYVAENYGDESQYDSLVESYGAGYLAKSLIKDKALEIVKGYAKVQ